MAFCAHVTDRKAEMDPKNRIRTGSVQTMGDKLVHRFKRYMYVCIEAISCIECMYLCLKCFGCFYTCIYTCVCLHMVYVFNLLFMIVFKYLYYLF